MLDLRNLLPESPFQLVHKHILKVTECFKELQVAFSFFGKDPKKFKVSLDKIIKLESEADKLKKEFKNDMRKKVLTPFGRRYFLSLLITQDRLINKAKDVVRLLKMQRSDISFMKEYKRFLISVFACSDQVVDLVEKVSKKGVFKRFGYNKYAASLEKFERASDQAGLDLTEQLFNYEGSIPALHIVLWLKIVLVMGKIPDLSVGLSNKIEDLMG